MFLLFVFLYLPKLLHLFPPIKAAVDSFKWEVCIVLIEEEAYDDVSCMLSLVEDDLQIGSHRNEFVVVPMFSHQVGIGIRARYLLAFFHLHEGKQT